MKSSAPDIDVGCARRREGGGAVGVFSCLGWYIDEGTTFHFSEKFFFTLTPAQLRDFGMATLKF
ncbi:MAG: hypothetical protein AAFU03_07720, partial [Bacteroidota bacterium]